MIIIMKLMIIMKVMMILIIMAIMIIMIICIFCTLINKDEIILCKLLFKITNRTLGVVI